MLQMFQQDNVKNIFIYLNFNLLLLESGKVLKAVVNASDSARNLDLNSFSKDFSVISQSWEVFPNIKIKSVRLLDPHRLLVLTESEMRVIRVDNCGKFSNCAQCLEIRDPHCGWDSRSSQCVAKNPTIPDKDRDENLVQDVNGGATHLCPAGTEKKMFSSYKCLYYNHFNLLSAKIYLYFWWYKKILNVLLVWIWVVQRT